MKEIAIINYGAGNLASLINAIEFLKFKPIILDKPSNKKFSHIFLPGVGNFGKLSENLRQLGFDDYLKEMSKSKSLIFGICVGMQLLFEKSEESPAQKGLGIIPGEIKKFSFKKNNLPLPHIGFTKVNHPNSIIWNDIPDESFFYFIHSFKLKEIRNFKSGKSNYGEDFISYIEKENIFGCQFHPEKSHKVGLKLLDNFMNYYV